MDLHWDILDKKRAEILPRFTLLKSEGFYLAGGTALALYLGHRDSIDFDFFKSESFGTGDLFERVYEALEGHEVVKTQEETDTLSVAIDENIRVWRIGRNINNSRLDQLMRLGMDDKPVHAQDQQRADD